MALVLKDRVKETTTTAGTGTITLAGAASGFDSFSSIGDGNTTYYAIVDTANAAWEVGLGTYTASGTTLSRDTVLESSNSDALVDFAAGAKNVFCTMPAEKAIVADGNGLTTLPDGLVVAGNLTVQGTTTTIEATNLAVADNMIYLRDGETTGNVDVGFAANYNDGTYAHAGFFRDATDGRWKVFDGYTPEPDAATDINTGHASFALADIQAANFIGDLTGDVTGNASSADALSTARTISVSGDVSGSVSFDGSANADIAVTVADDSHNHVIANVDGLQTALDAKQAAATAVTTTTSFGGDVSGTYDAIVVADDSHNHVISNVDGLQTALDGKQATGDYVVATGDTMTGNLSFGDNVKAQFGASNDLQIYHSGVDSRIVDSGTGNLTINATNFVVNNAADSQNIIIGNDGGAVTAYYAGSPKLATTSTGVEVTGSVFNTTGNFGRDTNDRVAVETSYIDFYVNGGIKTRIESDGDLHADGDVIAYSTTISDERLKENIVGIDGALDKVSQLNGYTFTYKADGKVSAGVIAQEVEKVLPEAVCEKELPLKANDGKEYKVVNYDALHGLLIEAIKEQQAQIDELKAKIG
jgi:hypothetical protein